MTIRERLDEIIRQQLDRMAAIYPVTIGQIKDSEAMIRLREAIAHRASEALTLPDQTEPAAAQIVALRESILAHVACEDFDLAIVADDADIDGILAKAIASAYTAGQIEAYRDAAKSCYMHRNLQITFARQADELAQQAGAGKEER